MIEKVRISLWDIFTFFMTGVLAFIVTCFVLAVTDRFAEQKVATDFLIKLPTTYIVVVAPIFLTLLGLLIEPGANFFERYLGKYLFFWVQTGEERQKPDLVVIENYIKTKGFGDLNDCIENPYFLCKEYVETKQLSTTFMVFLSRYGFYRNCSFIIFCAGVFYFADNLNCAAFMWLLVIYLWSALLTKRANEFYSYQAPAVYSAFLIDNLNWPSKQLTKNEPLLANKIENKE